MTYEEKDFTFEVPDETEGEEGELEQEPTEEEEIE